MEEGKPVGFEEILQLLMDVLFPLILGFLFQIGRAHV